MKCPPDSVDCSYCLLNPLRLTTEEYAELHFIPDPVPTKDGKYKEFSEVYGTETTDSARPGLKNNPVLTENDKVNRALFVAGRCYSILVPMKWVHDKSVAFMENVSKDGKTLYVQISGLLSRFLSFFLRLPINFFYIGPID